MIKYEVIHLFVNYLFAVLIHTKLSTIMLDVIFIKIAKYTKSNKTSKDNCTRIAIAMLTSKIFKITFLSRFENIDTEMNQFGAKKKLSTESCI